MALLALNHFPQWVAGEMQREPSPGTEVLLLLSRRSRRLPTMLDTVIVAADSSSPVLESEVILPHQFFERVRSEP
jgi:hypothetical protein